MAVVTVKSSQITNRDALPVVLSNDATVKGITKSACGQASVANGDSIASAYILCTIPSNARIQDVLLYSDAITSAAADIGLFDTTLNGGVVVSGQFFVAAQSLAAILTGTNLRKSAVNTVAKFEQFVWQVLGLAADPCKTYDVVVKLTAAATAAGSVAIDIRWS